MDHLFRRVLSVLCRSQNISPTAPHRTALRRGLLVLASLEDEQWCHGTAAHSTHSPSTTLRYVHRHRHSRIGTQSLSLYLGVCAVPLLLVQL